MNPLMLHVSQLISKVSISLFAGNAFYCSFVEHKARVECGSRIASTQFVPSYKRAALVQASLTSIASIASAVSYIGDRDPKWLVASLVMFGILPYTLVIMLPINKRLLDPNIDRDSNETKSLLEQWGVRHMVRTVLSVATMLMILNYK